MVKKMLIFICLIASIGSTFPEVLPFTKPVDCKSDEHCCVKSAASGCAECCPNKLDIAIRHPNKRDDMIEINERKEKDYCYHHNCCPSKQCLECVKQWTILDYCLFYKRGIHTGYQ